MKKITVVTSSRAKDHLLKARQKMQEMEESISMHKQKVDSMKMQQAETDREQKRFDDTNKSKQTLERLKKIL